MWETRQALGERVPKPLDSVEAAFRLVRDAGEREPRVRAIGRVFVRGSAAVSLYLQSALRPPRPERHVIGLSEYVDIPEWRIRGLRAKIDTGARSSALHVENLRETGKGRVRFDVRLHRLRSERRVTVEAPIIRRARVRSSTGQSQTRVFVAATIRIGPITQRIELGLVDRTNMIYRMLLGRTGLGQHFLVDPCGRYLLTSPPRTPVRQRDTVRPAAR